MKSNLKPNKIIGALVLSISVIGTPAFSAGIPTIDATAITQAIMTLEQLHREYEQLVKTYENQVKHFNAVTGIPSQARGVEMTSKFMAETSVHRAPMLLAIRTFRPRPRMKMSIPS